MYYAYLALYGTVRIEARHVFAWYSRVVFIDRQDNILLWGGMKGMDGRVDVCIFINIDL